jgi:hypothetical protein
MGVAAWSGRCEAADQGVTAVKLIAVDKGASGGKAVFVAKDPAVTKGAGTNPATIAVTLDIAYDNGVDAPISGQFVALEGSAGWLVNKATVAKYVNKTAPTGGGTKVAVVKPGKLVKLVGKNLGDTPLAILTQAGVPSGIADTSYRVTDSATAFDTSFCSKFSACAWKSIAGGTGAKLVCKGGAPTCGATPTTTTTLPPPGVVLQGALAATNGLFNYNLVLGIPGANAACNTNFAGTHACTFTELESAEAAGDLDALQDTTSATVTSFWAIDATHTDQQQCNDTMGTLLDWEYATAHTGVFAEVASLNNPTGALGAAAGAICANTSWVGCCL